MLGNWVAWPLCPPGYACVSQNLDIEQKAKVGQKKLALNKTIKYLS